MPILFVNLGQQLPLLSLTNLLHTNFSSLISQGYQVRRWDPNICHDRRLLINLDWHELFCDVFEGEEFDDLTKFGSVTFLRLISNLLRFLTTLQKNPLLLTLLLFILRLFTMSETEESYPFGATRYDFLDDQILQAKRLHVVITELRLAFRAHRYKPCLGLVVVLLMGQKVDFVKFWMIILLIWFLRFISVLQWSSAHLGSILYRKMSLPDVLMSLRSQKRVCMLMFIVTKRSLIGRRYKVEHVYGVIFVRNVEMTLICGKTLGMLLICELRCGLRSYA